MEIHGHHVNSANQTAYTYYVNAVPSGSSLDLARSKGWHKFSVSCDGGVVQVVYR